MNYIFKRLKLANRIIYFFKTKLVAGFIKNSVNAGYYNVKNFGDQLTPDILKQFGLHPFYAPVWRYADVAGVGSILHMLPDDFRGAILGSGFISEKEGKILPEAHVYLVRGHLTRRLLKLSNETPVGDPGLLADELYQDVLREVEPGWELGLVPHYIDKNHSSLLLFQEESPGLFHVIDVERPPQEVVRDIASCRRILSSSLHGLVVADSLGIPNRRMILSGKTIGGDFKYRDYYSSFNTMPSPILLGKCRKYTDLLEKIEPVDTELVLRVKHDIKKAVKRFVNDYLS